MKTHWCTSSIVKATIKSLAKILQENPSVAIIYTVSGLDIPIQRPEALFTTRRVVTEGVATKIVPFKTAIGYNVEESAVFRGECHRSQDMAQLHMHTPLL